MPYRRQSNATPKATPATKCGSCRAPLTKDEMGRKAYWCTTCADPDGHTSRLTEAQRKVRETMKEEFPPVKAEQMFIGDDI